VGGESACRGGARKVWSFSFPNANDSSAVSAGPADGDKNNGRDKNRKDKERRTRETRIETTVTILEIRCNYLRKRSIQTLQMSPRNFKETKQK